VAATTISIEIQKLIHKTHLIFPEMRAQALGVGQGGVCNQEGHLDAVAQGHHRLIHVRFPVKLFDAVLEIFQVGLGPLQALQGPDDAGVIP